MAGERKRSPPPAGRKPSWHQGENSGVWGRAPERARRLSSRAQPTSPCRLRGIGYLVCLYTQVSIPPRFLDRQSALTKLEENLRNQPENAVRKSLGKIVARYKLGLRMVCQQDSARSPRCWQHDG